MHERKPRDRAVGQSDEAAAHSLRYASEPPAVDGEKLGRSTQFVSRRKCRFPPKIRRPEPSDRPDRVDGRRIDGSDRSIVLPDACFRRPKRLRSSRVAADEVSATAGAAAIVAKGAAGVRFDRSG